MADDKLNQSDIDALIAKVRGTSSAPDTKADNTDSSVDNQLEKLGITEADKKGLTKLFKTSIEASTEVLRSITQKNVTIESIEEIRVAGRKELSSKISPPFIATKVDYIVGLRGLDLLLMKQSDMNNLMKLQFQSLGYEVDANDTEFIMSASNEVMNQMMGNASNKLGNELGLFIDISTPDSQMIEVNPYDTEGTAEIPFLKEDELSYVYTTFKLNIEGQVTGDLVKVLDTDFIEELRTIMHNGNYLEDNNISDTDKNNQSSSNSGATNSGEESMSSFESSQRAVDMMQQNNNLHMDTIPNPAYSQQNNPVYEPYAQQSYAQPTQSMSNHTQSTNIVQDSSIDVRKYELPYLDTCENITHEIASANRIKSVQVEMTVELGRTKMSVKEILELDKGSIIELNRLSGEHLDLYCNGTLIAKGEVVIIKDNFAFRVLSIVEQDYR